MFLNVNNTVTVSSRICGMIPTKTPNKEAAITKISIIATTILTASRNLLRSSLTDSLFELRLQKLFALDKCLLHHL